MDGCTFAQGAPSSRRSYEHATPRSAGGRRSAEPTPRSNASGTPRALATTPRRLGAKRDGKTPLQVTQCHDMATQREMWRRLYPKASDDAVDLLLQLMKYNPTKRKTAKEGLEHNYCAQFHDPESEVSYATKDGKNIVTISHHDNKKLNVQKYRDYLYGVDNKA